MKQTNSGKAFEYAIADRLASIFQIDMGGNEPFNAAHRTFMSQDTEERWKLIRAADEAMTFLIVCDTRFEATTAINLQSQMQGRFGDVRDVIVVAGNEEIGISAKNRNRAVKHSRLSDTIDFGKEWFGIECSPVYFRDTEPVFRDLRSRNGYWRDIPDKATRYYRPVLDAFVEELKALYRKEPAIVPERLLRYLLGRYDFYKVVKENGKVSIQSYNLDGSLRWGTRIQLKGEIEKVSVKRNSNTTADVIFSNGWHLSFRLHNAIGKIEPSLKFDVQVVGHPQSLRGHEIPIG